MERVNRFEQLSCDKALEQLKDGNARYVSGQATSNNEPAGIRADLATKGQFPFAVILGCADSRVPPEVVFDVGVGQIFVVRTAGNIADSVAVGSIEYAVEHLKARLIVVLGHDKCGAVQAAINGGDLGPNIGAIVNEIKPSVDKLEANRDADDFLHQCEDENIINQAKKLNESAILGKYVNDGTLKIVGAKYMLATGEVNFF